MDTHSPYFVPAETAAIEGKNRHRLASDSRRLALERPDAVSERAVESVCRLYDAACAELCEQVLGYVDRLVEHGQYDPDRDVLAFTADHGECLDPDRGMIGHVPPASWESLVHVPLVVARPDWPAEDVSAQTSLIDLPRMLKAPVGEGQPPTAFAREYALTVAGSLAEAGTVRGVRHEDGDKLFGRRTEDGVDVVQTTYEAGEPGTETVVDTWEGDETVRGAPTDLTNRLKARGGAVENGSYTPEFDESQLRSLGYLE